MVEDENDKSVAASSYSWASSFSGVTSDLRNSARYLITPSDDPVEVLDSPEQNIGDPVIERRKRIVHLARTTRQLEGSGHPPELEDGMLDDIREAWLTAPHRKAPAASPVDESDRSRSTMRYSYASSIHDLMLDGAVTQGERLMGQKAWLRASDMRAPAESNGVSRFGGYSDLDFKRLSSLRPGSGTASIASDSIATPKLFSPELMGTHIASPGEKFPPLRHVEGNVARLDAPFELADPRKSIIAQQTQPDTGFHQGEDGGPSQMTASSASTTEDTEASTLVAAIDNIAAPVDQHPTLPVSDSHSASDLPISSESTKPTIEAETPVTLTESQDEEEAEELMEILADQPELSETDLEDHACPSSSLSRQSSTRSTTSSHLRTPADTSVQTPTFEDQEEEDGSHTLATSSYPSSSVLALPEGTSRPRSVLTNADLSHRVSTLSAMSMGSLRLDEAYELSSMAFPLPPDASSRNQAPTGLSADGRPMSPPILEPYSPPMLIPIDSPKVEDTNTDHGPEASEPVKASTLPARLSSMPRPMRMSSLPIKPTPIDSPPTSPTSPTSPTASNPFGSIPAHLVHHHSPNSAGARQSMRPAYDRSSSLPAPRDEEEYVTGVEGMLSLEAEIHGLARAPIGASHRGSRAVSRGQSVLLSPPQLRSVSAPTVSPRPQTRIITSPPGSPATPQLTMTSPTRSLRPSILVTSPIGLSAPPSPLTSAPGTPTVTSALLSHPSSPIEKPYLEPLTPPRRSASVWFFLGFLCPLLWLIGGWIHDPRSASDVSDALETLTSSSNSHKKRPQTVAQAAAEAGRAAARRHVHAQPGGARRQSQAAWRRSQAVMKKQKRWDRVLGWSRHPDPWVRRCRWAAVVGMGGMCLAGVAVAVVFTLMHTGQQKGK